MHLPIQLFCTLGSNNHAVIDLNREDKEMGIENISLLKWEIILMLLHCLVLKRLFIQMNGRMVPTIVTNKPNCEIYPFGEL